jgi:hypothetical protein
MQAMVVTQLTPELIREGAILVEHLDEIGESPAAAFWLYTAERGSWKLVLAYPRDDEVDPRKLYRPFQKALRETLRSEVTHLVPLNVSLTRTNSALVKGLVREVKTPPGPEGFRLGRGVVNGVYVDDAHVYRVKRRAAKRRAA